VRRRGKVEVREHFDGQITVKFKGHYLEVHEVFEAEPIKTRQIKKPVNEKKKKGKYIPPADHSWRRYTPSLHHN
jgi:hypothetical protein